MKKLIYVFLFLALIGILFVRCEKEETIKPNDTLNQKIVNGSPWNFSKYEINNVVNLNGYDISDLEFENYIESYHNTWNGTTLNFNENGTGSSNNAPNFTWEIKNDNQITFNDGTTFDLSLSNSELIMRFRYGNIDIIDSQNGNEKRIVVDEQIIYN